MKRTIKLTIEIEGSEEELENAPNGNGLLLQIKESIIENLDLLATITLDNEYDE